MEESVRREQTGGADCEGNGLSGTDCEGSGLPGVAANGLLDAIRREFSCGHADIRTYSPLTLAFVGDCIYDLIIRTVLAERANAAPNTLHQKKSSVVKASAQAACIEAVLPELSGEELAVYKRGRNAHSHSVAKNAAVADYRKATGLEALYGFLYLTGRMERLLYLVKRSLEVTGSSLDLAEPLH